MIQVHAEVKTITLLGSLNKEYGKEINCMRLLCIRSTSYIGFYSFQLLAFICKLVKHLSLIKPDLFLLHAYITDSIQNSLVSNKKI